MDRGFDVPGRRTQVWPWLVQLGKQRGGWYLPRARRALRTPRASGEPGRSSRSGRGWRVGDRIPDYGGPEEYFEAVEVDAAAGHLVYRSERGRMQVSWAITLTPDSRPGTRVHLRLRLGPVRRVWLAETFGELVDALTIAGMAAGLRERG